MKIKRGDIVWIDTVKMGGCVQDGRRPALVVSNDVGNANSTILIVVPITAKIKKASLPTHMIIENCGLEYRSMIIMEQIYTVNRENVDRVVGHLDNKKIKEVNQKLKISLGVS